MAKPLVAIKNIFFDWDGTLADSAALGLRAFQLAFEDLAFPFPLDIYEATYSPNWYATYEALGLPKEQWEEADRLWLSHYGEQTADLIQGVAETLLFFKSKDYRLGVVSSGSETRVCREIDRSELRGCFDVIICNEQIVNKKPHPEGLDLAMQKLGSERAHSAYVGDAPEDIQMGRQADVLTIGVRSLYPGSARLLNENPDIFVESLSELPRYFGMLS
ncbi:MAG TPA: HAD family hydrolase [Pyrinomonadaceae bacterium]|jgi:HAD superfamily hydrolase (TIGR01509 family)|nr:HAD family hydrolase [Pyrinomonadaceae bacterium]